MSVGNKKWLELNSNNVAMQISKHQTTGDGN